MDHSVFIRKDNVDNNNNIDRGFSETILNHECNDGYGLVDTTYKLI
jgi:hypothetical protein